MLLIQRECVRCSPGFSQFKGERNEVVGTLARIARNAFGSLEGFYRVLMLVLQRESDTQIRPITRAIAVDSDCTAEQRFAGCKISLVDSADAHVEQALQVILLQLERSGVAFHCRIQVTFTVEDNGQVRMRGGASPVFGDGLAHPGFGFVESPDSEVQPTE